MRGTSAEYYRGEIGKGRLGSGFKNSNNEFFKKIKDRSTLSLLIGVEVAI